MSSVDALIEALKEFEGTVCCISHDLYFLNAIADHVVHIDHVKITVYPGDYEYFKHRYAQWREENPIATEIPVGHHKDKGKAEAAVEEDPKRKAKREAKIMAELEKLHAELEVLANQLSDPKIYEDYAKVQKIGEDMERVQSAIQQKEAEIG
jgi:ATP-binding cassette subfamily F protein 3